MGGEKKRADGLYIDPTGSPPRGRGKGTSTCTKFVYLRIIPAWAGKRRCTAACIWLCWDHPRMGGEKPLIWAVRCLL